MIAQGDGAQHKCHFIQHVLFLFVSATSVNFVNVFLISEKMFSTLLEPSIFHVIFIILKERSFYRKSLVF